MSETITLNIEGMTCDHCVRAVTEALEGVTGVSTADVSLEQKRAVVTGESVNTDALVAAIVEEGYEASTSVSG